MEAENRPERDYNFSEYDIVKAIAVYARCWAPEAMLLGNLSAQSIWTACEQVIENVKKE
jgi:hypothetical protein